METGWLYGGYLDNILNLATDTNNMLSFSPYRYIYEEATISTESMDYESTKYSE